MTIPSLTQHFDPSFYRGKKVFITGHTGFKGSWLCLWLSRLGAQVTGYALEPPTVPSLFQLARVENLVHSVLADVRDGAKLAQAIKAAAPEIVIHLAAQPIVRESYNSPVETYAINVMGTVNLLEAVRRSDSVQVVLNVTSDKCYENRESTLGYRENDPLGGYDPYSSSKGCSELVTAAYRRSYFNKSQNSQITKPPAVATARAGNVIGGGDWAADRLVPDCMKALMAGLPLKIRNPYSTRPWQHVLVPLSGYLLLIQRLYGEREHFACPWNFGPDENELYDVEWIVKRICDLWGGTSSYTIDDSCHPHEDHCLKLDCSKARSELKWSPKWDTGIALEFIIAWYRALQNGEDVRETCLKQIDEYMKP